MCSDSQDEVQKNVTDDGDSYESYDSEELRGTTNLRKDSLTVALSPISRNRIQRTQSEGHQSHGGSVASSKRSSLSRNLSGTSNRKSCVQEVSVSHVTNQRLTGHFGDSGFYTGTVVAGTDTPHGQGRLEYDKPGCFYEGRWKQGRWHGHGRLGNGKGDVYVGGMRHDLKHGYGKTKFAEGRLFQGRYILGEMREGTLTYPDGSSYKGEFRDDLPHGQGKSCFPDGSWYEGSFLSGAQCGRGTMHWPDGGVYEGEFWDCEITGFGIEYRADGSIRHDGLFRNGRPVRNPEAERWL